MKRRSSARLEGRIKRQEREDYARNVTILNKDVQMKIFSILFYSLANETDSSEIWKSITLVCKNWNQTARETLIRCRECDETVGSSLSRDLFGVGYETCNKCDKTTCLDCLFNDRGEESHINYCSFCEGLWCDACSGGRGDDFKCVSCKATIE